MWQQAVRAWQNSPYLAPHRRRVAMLTGVAACLVLVLALGLAFAQAAPISVVDADAAVPSVTVLAGSTFAITLESNGTTGYSWRLAQPPDERTARFVRNTFRPPVAALVGAPGQETWTFRAVAPGETSFTLHYVRPFAPSEPPAQATTVHVVVQTDGPNARFPLHGRFGIAPVILAFTAVALGIVAAGLTLRRSGRSQTPY